MTDAECIRFLQWALPILQLRWAGFRKVRGQVRKRLARRLADLELSSLSEYEDYLRSHSGEWTVLDSLCRITISRFYRDRGVFDKIRTALLPDLALRAVHDGKPRIRCLCMGCASGEEPYTLNVIWKLAIAPSIGTAATLEIVATEANSDMLARAIRGEYASSSLKDMPLDLAAEAFHTLEPGRYAIHERFKKGVQFIERDIRDSHPGGMFHLVLCRNLVFTYFDEALQSDALCRIEKSLIPGGYLVIGAHESIPSGFRRLVPHDNGPCIYRFIDTASSGWNTPR